MLLLCVLSRMKRSGEERRADVAPPPAVCSHIKQRVSKQKAFSRLSVCVHVYICCLIHVRHSQKRHYYEKDKGLSFCLSPRSYRLVYVCCPCIPPPSRAYLDEAGWTMSHRRNGSRSTSPQSKGGRKGGKECIVTK